MNTDKPVFTDRVTTCSYCPYAIPEFGTGWLFCHHPEVSYYVENTRIRETLEYKDPPIPRWCPLRKGPTLVKLDEDSTKKTA